MLNVEGRELPAPANIHIVGIFGFHTRHKYTSITKPGTFLHSGVLLGETSIKLS